LTSIIRDIKAHISYKDSLPSKDTTNFNLEGLLLDRDTFRIFYSFFENITSSKKLEMITFDLNGLKIETRNILMSLRGKMKKKLGAFQ
jgi:hypothetical protein